MNRQARAHASACETPAARKNSWSSSERGGCIVSPGSNDGPAGANELPSFRHSVPEATKKSLQAAGARAAEPAQADLRRVEKSEKQACAGTGKTAQ